MPNRFELGHMAWPILTQAAAERRVLTYEKLTTAMGYHTAKVARFALWTIQDFCKEKGYPPLTGIVVSKSTGMPSSGFTARDGDIEEAQDKVLDFEWANVSVPFP